MRKLIIYVLLICFDSQIAFSLEPPENIPVRDFLNRVLEIRLKPIAFEMEFRIRKNVLEKDNTSEKDAYGTLVETSGIMRVDELAGISFVESTAKLLQSTSSDPKAEQNIKHDYKQFVAPGMRLILPDREYVCDPRVGRIVERKKDTMLFVEVPLFDFRIFGWATDYNFKHGHSIEEVLSALKVDLKPELNFAIGKDNVATLDLGNEETRVDVDRGYWPIDRKVWSSMNKENRFVKESVRVGLVKFGDEWVPNRVDWKIEGKKSISEFGFDFKWISLNTTIDPDRMSLAYMIRRLAEGAKEEKKGK